MAIKNKNGLLFIDNALGSLDNKSVLYKKNYSDLAATNASNSASFRYNLPGDGVVSTQELNVDWSRFENHTFFNSALVNVNVAVHKIINEFPFDGTRQEVEGFFDRLTGFQKWVYDQFPKNKGYLIFSGSGVHEANHEGTVITVQDYAGALYPSLSSKKTGESILDPKGKPISFEMHLFADEIANDNQVILQKLSGSNGITLHLSESSSTTSAPLEFLISSGTVSTLVSADILKGEFSHVVALYDPSLGKSQLFVNQILQDESVGRNDMRNIDFSISPLTIGSGSTHTTDSFTRVPAQTFAGALDDLRVWHSSRTAAKQRLYAKKAVYNTDDLVLYYKFNEPTGSYDIDSTILDSSGNGLHTQITNFTGSLRTTGTIDVPMTHEKLSLSPVLFPAFDSLTDLNLDLIASASAYDNVNPNTITKLVPRHYFYEGQVNEGFEDEEGTIINVISGSSIPGSAELGTAQLLQTLLYTWAQYFDELKLMIDAFGNVLNIDYDSEDNVPDQFLQFFARYYGFELPALFSNASIDQYVHAEDIGPDVGTNALSLRQVQNQMWRRILINMQDITRSKGTLHSIRSFLRTVGIRPDDVIRIREFGGPTLRSLRSARHERVEVSTLLNMSGSTSFISSSFLTGSRVEVGFPEAVGSFVSKGVYPPHGISDDESDGLFTSGSWAYEATYRLPTLQDVTQSLARINVNGSSFSDAGVVFNLVAMNDQSSGSIKLFGHPSTASISPTLELELTGTDIFDNEQWHISFGAFREDDPAINSSVSSSYYISAIKQSSGKIIAQNYTSSFFSEVLASDHTSNVLRNASTQFNASGPYITVGDETITSSDYFLNTGSISDQARVTTFNGKLGQMRFWSKALDRDELREHARTFKSVGVLDPALNFNFVTELTGAFNRLRMDVSTDQEVTQSDSSGQVRLFDFSQNHIPMFGTGFEESVDVIVPETFKFHMLSSKFDESHTTEKVRVRSYQDATRLHDYAVTAPLYQVPPNDDVNDDVRLSIDFSIIDALDEDIVKIFATFDEIESAIGSPELLYSPDYPALENLRRIYFNRLTDKINLKAFFEFFKWFDSSMGDFIEQLIPRKTDFRGINFVVESHMLERNKVDYKSPDQYMGPARRHSSLGNIYLQQLVGILKRY